MFKFLKKKKQTEKDIIEGYDDVKLKLDNKSNLILVVDDSEINRDFLTLSLKRLRYETKEARNGREAITLMETNNFNLVYVDVTMPILDGINMTRIVRKLGYTGPIIGITGHVDHDSVNECKEAGMNKVLAKPIDLETIKYNTEHYIEIEKK